jgi:hypothetical protein
LVSGFGTEAGSGCLGDCSISGFGAAIGCGSQGNSFGTVEGLPDAPLPSVEGRGRVWGAGFASTGGLLSGAGFASTDGLLSGAGFASTGVLLSGADFASTGGLLSVFGASLRGLSARTLGDGSLLVLAVSGRGFLAGGFSADSVFNEAVSSSAAASRARSAFARAAGESGARCGFSAEADFSAGSDAFVSALCFWSVP